MPLFQDNVRLATIPIANLATGGAIGTAAATVDVASAFAVNQTTAAQSLTLPVPTIANAGLIVLISNVGTVSFTINGVSVPVNSTNKFTWNGTAWTTDSNLGRNSGIVVTLATMTAGNNTVTHNLNLPTGSFSSIDFTARNNVGQDISLRRVTASDTANAFVVNTVLAVTTPTTFYIFPLA
jgi:hypothetical protein